MTQRVTYPDLVGRNVVVTGGATGLGAAFVRAFQANGCNVAFLDIDQIAGAALEAELGAGVRFYFCDLTDPAALDAALDAVMQGGTPTVLVNNAAVDRRMRLDEIDVAQFEWMMNVNLRHVVFCARKLAPGMLAAGGGSIINLSSVAWMRGIENLELYSAAKAAIVGFTNALARSLGPGGVRVNAVAPGTVLTPRQRALWFGPQDEAAALSRQCLAGLVLPEDVANTVLFLASDAARMITKQCIAVNAGSY